MKVMTRGNAFGEDLISIVGIRTKKLIIIVLMSRMIKVMKLSIDRSNLDY